MKTVCWRLAGSCGVAAGPALETFLRRQPGVHHVAASSVSNTVTVGYDDSMTSESRIRRLILAHQAVLHERSADGRGALR